MAYLEFRPILDRIIVKRLDECDETGITVPKKYRQHSNKGIVVAIGDFVVLGGLRVPLSDLVNVGDIVLVGEYNSEKFEKDGEELWIVRLQDVRGIEKFIPAPSEEG